MMGVAKKDGVITKDIVLSPKIGMVTPDSVLLTKDRCGYHR